MTDSQASDEQLAWTEEEQAAMLRVHEHFRILARIAAERKQAIDAIEELERRAIAEIQRISEKEVAAERERCAKTVETYRKKFQGDEYGDAYSPYDICTEIAEKIRESRDKR